MCAQMEGMDMRPAKLVPPVWGRSLLRFQLWTRRCPLVSADQPFLPPTFPGSAGKPPKQLTRCLCIDPRQAGHGAHKGWQAPRHPDQLQAEEQLGLYLPPPAGGRREDGQEGLVGKNSSTFSSPAGGREGGGLGKEGQHRVGVSGIQEAAG